MNSIDNRRGLAFGPRLLQPGSMPLHLQMSALDQPWADVLLRAPQAFAHVQSLRVEQPAIPEQAAHMLRSAAANERPNFLQVASLFAPEPDAIIGALRLNLAAERIKVAHIGSQGPHARGDQDISELFRRYPCVEVASVCRPIVRSDRIRQHVAREAIEGAGPTGQRVGVTAQRWFRLLAQTQSTDVARSIFCAGKEVERRAPDSLLHFGLVFDAREVSNFRLILEGALFSSCDQADPDGPMLAERLVAFGKRPDNSPGVAWGFAGLCGRGSLEMFTLQGFGRDSLRLQPGRWPLDPLRPLELSVLSKLPWSEPHRAELLQLTRPAAAV